jgi:serine/threonine-protein kinase RsbW
MSENIKIDMRLPKIPDIELVALEGLKLMGGHLGIPEDKIGEANIIVTEAIINALEHSGDETPYVNVEFTMTKEKIIILVRDFGKGFDPDKIKDPEISDKLSSSHKRGWGLKLMKSMSDGFEIESGPDGTKITIIKNLV